MTNQATVAISYYLTETGRRASLLAGGDGKREQTVHAPITSELLAAVPVSSSGIAATYLYSGGVGVELDAPMSAEEAATRVLAEVERAKSVALAKRAEGTAQWRAAASAYLADQTSQAYFEHAGVPGLQSAGYANHTDCTPEEIAAVKAEHGRRVQAQRDAETVKLRAEIPRWMAGEINGFSTAPSKSGLSDKEKAAINTEYERREQKATDDKIAAAQARLDERDAWIRAHGSPRLIKGLELGQIGRMTNVYRDERIAHDLGTEWISWSAAPEPDDNDLLNPSEAALDALSAAKTKWPTSDPRLCSVGGTDKRGDEHDWRTAIMIDAPWDKSVTAIKYIDE